MREAGLRVDPIGLPRTSSSPATSASACFLDDFERCTRTLSGGSRPTDLLARLFGPERRRTEVIPHAFGERA
jgi:hypothetical protein